MTGRPQSPFPDQGDLGPAMSALPNDRWRAFVVALCEQPVHNYAEAARQADPEVWGKTSSTAKNAGYRLAHDERVQAAIIEEGQRRMGAAVSISVQALVQIAQSGEPKDRLKAIGMILNRAGLPEQKDVRVQHERVLSEVEKIEAVIRLADKLHLDPKQLLGDAGIPIPERLNAPSTVSGTSVASPTVGQVEEIKDAEFTEAVASDSEDWSTL